MLDTFRKAAKTWPLKVFMAVLIASFGVWGVDAYLKGGGFKAQVAKVGKQDISVAEFDRQFRLQLAKARKIFGQEIPMKEIIPVIQAQVYQQLVEEKLLDVLASTIDLQIADAVIADVIRKEFSDKDTSFSNEKFKMFLRSSGYSEAQFIETLKKNVQRQFMASSIFPNVQAPRLLVNPLYQDYYTPRNLEVIMFDASKVTIKKPTERDLKDFYEDHKEAYRVPELRTVEALVFDPATKESNIRREHPSYSSDELRQAAIEANHKYVLEVEDKIAGGSTFSEISQEYGSLIHEAKKVNVEGKNKNGQDGLGTSLITSEMLKTAFALDLNAESDISDTKEGVSYIIKVIDIVPSQIPAYPEVKKKVEQDYESKARAEALMKKTEEIAQKLNGGSVNAATASKNIRGTVRLYNNISSSSKIPLELSEQVLSTLFRGQKGKFYPVVVGSNAYVGRVLSLGELPKKGPAEQKNFESVRNGLKAALAGILSQAMLEDIKEKNPVVPNTAMLKQLFSTYTQG